MLFYLYDFNQRKELKNHQFGKRYDADSYRTPFEVYSDAPDSTQYLSKFARTLTGLSLFWFPEENALFYVENYKWYMWKNKPAVTYLKGESLFSVRSGVMTEEDYRYFFYGERK